MARMTVVSSNSEKKGFCPCFCYFYNEGKNPQNPSLLSGGQRAPHGYTKDLRSSERQGEAVSDGDKLLPVVTSFLRQILSLKGEGGI